jgi:hypothetical protein
VAAALFILPVGSPLDGRLILLIELMMPPTAAKLLRAPLSLLAAPPMAPRLPVARPEIDPIDLAAVASVAAPDPNLLLSKIDAMCTPNIIIFS